MDGEQDATQTEGQQQEQGDATQLQEGQDVKANQPQAVGADEWRKALAAKDAQIAELQGKVTAAAKTAEATEALNAEIASLKRQMADERPLREGREGAARGPRRRHPGARGGRALALRGRGGHFTKDFTNGRDDRAGACGRERRVRCRLHEALGDHRRPGRGW